jgi:hypothetical protein
MLDRSGKLWRGEDHEDLAEYVREFQAGGFPVAQVVESVCARCGGRTFRVTVDAAEERARRTCVDCGTVAYVGDSEGRWDETGTVECECPCGSREFAMAIGFALSEAGDVRWISVGLWCLTDNALAIYADWGVDYSPSEELLRRV